MDCSNSFYQHSNDSGRRFAAYHIVKRSVFVILLILSGNALAATVLLSTQPSGASVNCNGSTNGKTPLIFKLDAGEYECLLDYGGSEPYLLKLDVGNEDRLVIEQKFDLNKSSDSQLKPKIIRTGKITKKIVIEDYSKEAEKYLISLRGERYERKLKVFIESKSSDSDAGATFTASELQELKRP